MARTKPTGSTSNKWGILSVIIAIIGFLFIAGIILGVIAIYFGYLGLKYDKNKKISKAGIGLGILCTILGIIWLIIYIIFH